MPKYAELRHGALGLRLRGLLKRLSTVSTPLDFSHGSTRLVSIDLAVGEIAMFDWKADLDTLVEDTTTFAKRVRVEPTMPRTVVEPDRMPGRRRSARRSGIASRTSKRISSASKGSGKITPPPN